MTTQHTNPFPHPLMVDTDPEDSECWSVWCDNGQGSSAEIASRICDKSYAAFIVRAVNSHAALIEACETALANLAPKYASDHLVIKSLRAALESLK